MRRPRALGALEANKGKKLLLLRGLLREIGQKCLKRRRLRRRRLHVYSTDPRRPQGDLLGRDRQDLTGAAAMEHGVVGRELKKKIFRPLVSVPLISLDH